MITHRIITVALLAALAPLALTTPVAAGAPADDVARHSEFRPGTRPCFLVRIPWNVALDGQPPRCG